MSNTQVFSLKYIAIKQRTKKKLVLPVALRPWQALPKIMDITFARKIGLPMAM